MLTSMSTLVKSGDPTFAPVRKLVPELLAEIFTLCISEPVKRPGHEPPNFECRMYLQAARGHGQLARVCRWWNAVLNDDPRVWATVTLDAYRSITPEIVTHGLRDQSRILWTFISSSVIALIRTQWLRCFMHSSSGTALSFGCCHNSFRSLFPPSVSAYALMMQNLCLVGYPSGWTANWGDIHCADLRILIIEFCDEAVKSLISKPMPSVRHLHLMSDGPARLCIELLDGLPNLVSMKWMQKYDRDLGGPNIRVVLQSLEYFYAPSLESLKMEMAQKPCRS